MGEGRYGYFMELHNVIKTDSTQSSSNKRKNYLIQFYSQHGTSFNTIYNISLKVISLSDPAKFYVFKHSRKR